MSEPKTMSFEDRIIGLVKELCTAKLTKLDKAIDSRVGDFMKCKEEEATGNLQKALGLESDPVIHMSDLISLGRKQALEQGEPVKKSPALEATATPEGTIKTSPIDALLRKYNMKLSDKT